MNLEIAVTVSLGIIIPWILWVTSSIYSQRQEIALLKQIFEFLKEKLIRD